MIVPVLVISWWWWWWSLPSITLVLSSTRYYLASCLVLHIKVCPACKYVYIYRIILAELDGGTDCVLLPGLERSGLFPSAGFCSSVAVRDS